MYSSKLEDGLHRPLMGLDCLAWVRNLMLLVFFDVELELELMMQMLRGIDLCICVWICVCI